MERLKSDTFPRLGFHYINILWPDEHHISILSDTNITVTVRNERLTHSLSLSYKRILDTNHTVTVKVSTPDFVIGQMRPGFSLLCDIDVASKTEVFLSGFEATLGWIKTAHDLGKEEFFKILPDEITSKLSVTEGTTNE